MWKPPLERKRHPKEVNDLWRAEKEGGEMRRKNLQWVLFLCGGLGVSLRGMRGGRTVGFAAARPPALHLVPEQPQAH